MGSPNKEGSTNILAESFSRGAKEAGHEVEILKLEDLNINPCTGCLHCGYEGPCSQNDDNPIIKNALLDADMIVLATPLYYYGMSAQLKTVVDRFCSYNSRLNRLLYISQEKRR